MSQPLNGQWVVNCCTGLVLPYLWSPKDKQTYYINTRAAASLQLIHKRAKVYFEMYFKTLTRQVPATNDKMTILWLSGFLAFEMAWIGFYLFFYKCHLDQGPYFKNIVKTLKVLRL